MWHDPDDRLQKAVERFEEGDVEAARAMLRSLDRLGVISPRIDLYLGHCHIDEDRPLAALRRYRRAIALRGDDAAPWVGIALCHGRLGQVGRAVEALQRAAALDPDREEVHCHLVHCYALLGRLAEARSHARRAARLDPTCPHVHRHMAVAWLLSGRPAQALQAWRRVQARDPDHPEALVGIGRCFAAMGRREEARETYRRALGGEFAADAHSGLGDLAWMTGRPTDAASHYRNALTCEPDHPEARLRLAEVEAEQGRAAEGWAVLEPLAAAWTPPAPGVVGSPGDLPGASEGGQPGGAESWRPDPEVAGVAATLQRDLGRRREALTLLRRMVAAAPDMAEAWTALGRHLLEGGRPRMAVRILRRARRLERRRALALESAGESGGALPDALADGAAARLLARALGRAGRRREAVAVLAGAVHQRPEGGDLQLDLAAALLACGRADKAERALLRGLERLPAHAGLWTAAAELAFESGRWRRARHRIRIALRHDVRHGEALALLVRWHLVHGSPRRALHAARAALRVLPADHVTVRDHGKALLQCGRPEEAAIPLRRYVLSAPSDPEGYELLGLALEAAGDERGATTQRRLGQFVGAGV